jgi:MinD-like ATPase involved in chromosome partitioning or flagellar assembly
LALSIRSKVLKIDIEDVLVQGTADMLILAASAGIQQRVHLSTYQRCKLFSQLEALEYRFDFLLIDTAARISSDVMYFNKTTYDIIIIVTPEPTFITGAYALLQSQSIKYGANNFKIIKPLTELYPIFTAAQCLQRFTKPLTNIPNCVLTQNEVPGFWQQLLTGSHDQPATLLPPVQQRRKLPVRRF